METCKIGIIRKYCPKFYNGSLWQFFLGKTTNCTNFMVIKYHFQQYVDPTYVEKFQELISGKSLKFEISRNPNQCGHLDMCGLGYFQVNYSHTLLIPEIPVQEVRWCMKENSFNTCRSSQTIGVISLNASRRNVPTTSIHGEIIVSSWIDNRVFPKVDHSDNDGILVLNELHGNVFIANCLC